jgi:hypothetical protein
MTPSRRSAAGKPPTESESLTHGGSLLEKSMQLQEVLLPVL